MANIAFELASSETEGQFRRLLRDNPLAGNIHVLLTREPDAFHAAAVSGDVFELLLAYRETPRSLIGGCARFELDAFINGDARRIGYLGELRMQGGLRQRRNALIEGYRQIRRLHEAGGAPFYLTTIVADNLSTRRLLERGLGDMPTYRPLETMTTLTMSTRRLARLRHAGAGIEIVPAGGFDTLAARLNGTGRDYQFHPVWSADTLRSGTRCRGIALDDFVVAADANGVRGLLCLWDQRAFKQTVVAGYSRRLARLRPLLNLAAPALRQPRLPAPGGRLESAFLSHLSVDAGDEAALLALVGEAARRARDRGIDYLMLGLAERHPLRRTLQKRLNSHSYVSVIYVVYWDDGRGAASSIDDRVPHPELALL